ncbi:O-antigen ligase domain-containing protein [Microvirga sp. c27j1]|uniref:O-antigen ligase family protein n=1 Tax=Microvirga flavescens TaxID=2249811 RepID=UPI000DD85E41
MRPRIDGKEMDSPSIRAKPERTQKANRRTGRPRRGGAAEEVRHEQARRRKKLPWPVTLFLVSLVIPWIIQLGPVRASAYRLVLLATLVPTLIMWLSGKAGRIRTADFALIAYALWCGLSLAANYGVSATLQPSAILFIETAGSYLLARCYIRDADDFYNVISLLFKIVAFTFPFAVIESVTSRNIALELFGMVMPTPVDTNYDPRWGMRRVQGYYEHPILFGVATGCILAPVYLVLGYQKPVWQRSWRSMIVIITSFLSMSAGPTSAVVAQGMLLTWNRVLHKFKDRWKVMWGLVLVMYLFVEVVSNQSVPEFFMTHFSFDEVSAYYRVLIWRFGSASALSHPVFGVGFERWERPSWMPPSIDMFWLYHAIIYGLPAAFMMMLAFISLFVTVGLKKGLGDRLTEYRTAYLISMTGFFLVGWTVHFWNAVYVLFLFLLGSGAWILDAKTEGDSRVKRRGTGRATPKDHPAAVGGGHD